MRGYERLLLLVCGVCAAHARTQSASIRPMWFSSDRVYFKNDQDQKPEAMAVVNQTKEIPLDLIRQLNNVYNLSDFIENFIDSQSFENVSGEEDLLKNRFGEPEERKNTEFAKDAKCMPELTVVPLINSSDTTLVYYPQCIRVERCGGCCYHNLYSCQPTEIEIVNYQVYVAEYTGNKMMSLRGKEVVSVEKHITCKCNCIIKKKDCNTLQDYNENECRCLCLNVDEKFKCATENDTKIWDPHSCSCVCRDVKECGTGYAFDKNSCRCAQISSRNRSTLQARRRRGEMLNKNWSIRSKEQSSTS